jgi:hypothetical protein
MEMIDINTPEELLSRQLASQRTGFAIVGPGRIQRDLFPVLEYAAPRAFFLSAGTRVLERFDERTRQQLLAPLEKRETLAGIPSRNTQLIFTDFSTVNGELFASVFGTPAGTGVPCVFQNTPPPPAPASTDSPVDRAENAFAAGDLDQAQRLAAEALAQRPGDEMATYVARVVERQRELERK